MEDKLFAISSHEENLDPSQNYVQEAGLAH